MKVISPKRLLQSVFPTVRNGSIFNASSLDLQFARTKTLDPRVTFTRASSGTYVDSQGVIRTATTNEARFDHNPTTGESLGLLVEEARTNNVLQSEDFATTWTASNLTVTTNSVVAPDGTATADTIAPPADGLTVTRFLRQNPVLTTQQAYTLSVFVKVGTATTNGIALYVSDSAATNNFRGVFNLFTLATGASGTGWATPTSTIVPYPNGWYRCILSGVTSTAHTGLRAQIYLSAFGTTPDTYGSIHVWGAQLEAGSFPTSYIPTTTAAATRSADVASITGSNFSSWYRLDEGTVFAEYRTPTSGTRGVAGFNDSTANERIALFTNGTDPKLTVIDGGAPQADLNGGTIVSGVMTKSAGAYAVNDFAFAHAGGTAVTDATGTLPTVNRLLIGADQSGNYQNGRLKRLTFWPQRLPNTTLQQITQ